MGGEIAVAVVILVIGLFIGTMWKKSPMETDYMTSENCRKCREACQAQRSKERDELLARTSKERDELKEEIRGLGASIDSLRTTILEYVLRK